jgi:hypothetical protein
MSWTGPFGLLGAHNHWRDDYSCSLQDRTLLNDAQWAWTAPVLSLPGVPWAAWAVQVPGLPGALATADRLGAKSPEGHTPKPHRATWGRQGGLGREGAPIAGPALPRRTQSDRGAAGAKGACHAACLFSEVITRHSQRWREPPELGGGPPA